MGTRRQVTSDPLIAYMDAGDRRRLSLATEAEASASLRRLMDEEESRSSEFDCERLMKAAWALEQSGRWIAPAVAIAWLKERPSHERLAVVLSVLLVSWNSPTGTPQPDPALVEGLLSVYDSLPFDVISENGLLIVLIRAIKSGLPAPLVARVRSRIERAREMPDRQPEIREMLDAFLSTPSD